MKYLKYKDTPTYQQEDEIYFIKKKTITTDLLLNDNKTHIKNVAT